jgi:hypothetical protein
MIDPRSKISLKFSCLAAAKGDVEYAEKLYNFFASDVDSLPDFDVPKPTALQQIKDGAGQIFGWVKENKSDIIEAVGYIQSLRGGTAASAAQSVGTTIANEIPPLPTT